MNRLLISAATGLLLGLTPAVAQTPADETQSPPAMHDPAMPSEIIQDESPARRIPDASSEMPPQASPDQPSPSAETTEVPKSISPDQQAGAPSGSPQFVSRQENSDWLASDLIGKAVVNADNETVGDVNDIVSDKNGNIIAVLIGAGGFLGLGEKDVALRFEDLQLSRDENNEVFLVANVSEDMLASAPDFETLREQTVTLGAREDIRDESEEKEIR